jgi:hypothetical protein
LFFSLLSFLFFSRQDALWYSCKNIEGAIVSGLEFHYTTYQFVPSSVKWKYSLVWKLYFKGLLSGLNKLISIKLLKQCLALMA